jgi:HSP20 family molecular chaperone IbpA
MTALDDRNRIIQVHRRRETVEQRGLYFHRHEIHALFEEMIHRPWAAARWNPAVDIRESREAFLIEMDLPGVKSEDVRVVVDGRMLMVEGHRQLAKCDGVTTHVCERPAGRFMRTFEFDDEIEKREIKSHWQDGVLTVAIPKPRSK